MSCIATLFMRILYLAFGCNDFDTNRVSPRRCFLVLPFLFCDRFSKQAALSTTSFGRTRYRTCTFSPMRSSATATSTSRSMSRLCLEIWRFSSSPRLQQAFGPHRLASRIDGGCPRLQLHARTERLLDAPGVARKPPEANGPALRRDHSVGARSTEGSYHDCCGSETELYLSFSSTVEGPTETLSGRRSLDWQERAEGDRRVPTAGVGPQGLPHPRRHISASARGRPWILARVLL